MMERPNQVGNCTNPQDLDFSSALQQLAEAHEREVQGLRSQIRHLGKMEDWKTTAKAQPPLSHGTSSENEFVDMDDYLNDTAKRLDDFGPDDFGRVALIFPVEACRADEPVEPDLEYSHHEAPWGSQRQSTPGATPLITISMSQSHSLSEFLSGNKSTYTVESDSSIKETALIAWCKFAEGLLHPRLILHPGWSGPGVEVQASGSEGGRHSANPETTTVFIQKLALERLEQKFSKEHRLSNRRRSSGRYRISIVGSHEDKFLYGMTSSKAKQRWRCCCTLPKTLMMHPASSKRLAWIFTCFCVLAYDTFILTMNPFFTEEYGWLQTVDMMLACFWTLDILLNFQSGIFVNGKIEMSFAAVAKSYLYTWCVFDCAVVSVQWYAVYDELAGNVKTPATWIKLIRLVRTLRIGKITALLAKEELLIATLGSATHQLLHRMIFSSTVTTMLIAAVFFIHCSACIWYELGNQGDGWVSKYNFALRDGAVLRNYLVSLHWTLSQFQGNIDIYPGNSTSNRAFACASSCLSIVALAGFVSTLTDVLVNLREDRKRRGHEIRLMRGFLDRHLMPADLLARATHYIRTRQQEQHMRQKLNEDDQALRLYAPHLRRHMHTEMIAQHVCKIPIFGFLKNFHYKMLVTVSSKAIYSQMFDAEEDLFMTGDLAKQAYTIVKGELVFSANPKLLQMGSLLLDASVVGESIDASDFVPGKMVKSEKSIKSVVTNKSLTTRTSSEMQLKDTERVENMTRGMNLRRRTVKRLTHGDFVSEAALWITLCHDGDLTTVNMCQCFLLDANSFVEIVAAHTIPHIILSDYANRYVNAAGGIKNDQTQGAVYVDLIDSKAVLQYEACNRGNCNPSIPGVNDLMTKWRTWTISSAGDASTGDASATSEHFQL